MQPLAFLDFTEPFMIAEIGGNHEGDFDYALKLLNDALESGAHAVKFQTYQADKIVSQLEGAERHKHFSRLALQTEHFVKLAEITRKAGKIFMSSLWDADSLEALDPYIPIHKVGSGDLTNYPLLELIAKKNKPVILSTAMATLDEVREAVQVISKVNHPLVESGRLAILHCVAMYGAPRDEYANLNAISVLREAFPHYPIGYSDHTEGIYACEIAIALGACILEFHFTDDKTRAYRDHQISITKEEVKDLIARGKRLRALLGPYSKLPVSEIETPARIRDFRRAVYPVADCPAGTVLTRTNLTTLRPNQGIDARRFEAVLGKRLRVAKRAFEALSEDDLE